MTAGIAVCIGVGLLIASFPSGSILGTIGALALIASGTVETLKEAAK